MHLYFRTFLLIIFSSLTLMLSAQVSSRQTTPGENSESIEGNEKQNDSLLNVGNPKNVKVRGFQSKYIGFDEKVVVDTVLHGVELYNPTKQNLSYAQDLGIIGSASKSIILPWQTSESFQLGFDAFDRYTRRFSDIEIIETPTPFSDLSYVMGSKKENVLGVKHAQSFKNETIRAGFDLKLYNDLGYYKYQKTDIKNFNTNFSYQTPNKRYQAEVVYLHNKLVIQENGGIIYDSIYQNNLESNRQIISVNLKTAENYIKSSGFAIKQKFYLSKPEPDYSVIPDTNTISYDGYSVQHYRKPYFDPIPARGQITHTLTFLKNLYQYSDTEGESSFYANLPGITIDTNQTFDSITHRKFENTFTYSNADYTDSPEHPKHLYYSFGISIAAHNYSQDSISHSLTELKPLAQLQLFYNKNLHLLTSGFLAYRSNNETAYQLKGEIYFKWRESVFNVQLKSISSPADWKYQHFHSTYFNWDNAFANQKQQDLAFFFNWKNTKLIFNTGVYHDFLYFNENIQPAQSATPVSYFKAQAGQIVRLGNVGLDINVTYQTTSNSQIIRIPTLYSNAKLYYENTLFKGALDLNAGINVRYFSSYYVYDYMPALRTFYIQNTYQFGNTPIMDVFIDAKVKGARLFLKYEHVNAGFMPENYFASPHYPFPDASLKFGVKWQIFN